jgi:hypothetical protein
MYVLTLFTKERFLQKLGTDISLVLGQWGLFRGQLTCGAEGCRQVKTNHDMTSNARCWAIAMVAMVAIEFILAMRVSLYNESIVKVHESDFVHPQIRMPVTGTPVENGQATVDLRKSFETGENISKETWSDAHAKSNTTRHGSSVVLDNTELVLPNILLIGAQKAGTTTVNTILLLLSFVTVFKQIYICYFQSDNKSGCFLAIS